MVSDVISIPKFDMVARVHGIAGSAAAFFKESMRRDAIIGTKTVFTLWDPGLYRSPNQRRRKKDLHSGEDLNFVLCT